MKAKGGGPSTDRGNCSIWSKQLNSLNSLRCWFSLGFLASCCARYCSRNRLGEQASIRSRPCRHSQPRPIPEVRSVYQSALAQRELRGRAIGAYQQGLFTSANLWERTRNHDTQPSFLSARTRHLLSESSPNSPIQSRVLDGARHQMTHLFTMTPTSGWVGETSSDVDPRTPRSFAERPSIT
jgi:hypothetical protein